MVIRFEVRAANLGDPAESLSADRLQSWVRIQPAVPTQDHLAIV